MKVDLSDKDLYTGVYFKLAKAKTRLVVNFGGAGSSKSVSQHQLELTNILDAKHDTLFIRKHATDIEDSCYTLLKNIAHDWGITHLFKWNYSNDKRQITNLNTGQRILFKGIDDPEKLKSIVGIKRIVVEEASQLVWSDFTEIMRRVRGIKGIQIILLLNPISEYHWIKTKIIDSGWYSDILTIIHSTYLDNRFLTEEDIAEQMRLKLIDENQYRIYTLGEWGVEDKTGKFAYSFDKDKHVRKGVEWNKHDYTYLSFDFNVNPICCSVIQHTESKIKVVQLIKLKDSNIYSLCDYIKAKYYGAMFIVTGDATGKARSALVEDNLNYYTVIKHKLRLTEASMQVPTVNPRIAENKVLVNAVLMNVDVEIDEEMAEGLVFDLTYCEVTADNKLKKDNRSDEKQQADALDTFRYYLNMFWKHILQTN